MHLAESVRTLPYEASARKSTFERRAVQAPIVLSKRNATAHETAKKSTTVSGRSVLHARPERLVRSKVEPWKQKAASARRSAVTNSQDRGRERWVSRAIRTDSWASVGNALLLCGQREFAGASVVGSKQGKASVHEADA